MTNQVKELQQKIPSVTWMTPGQTAVLLSVGAVYAGVVVKEWLFPEESKLSGEADNVDLAQ